MSGRVLMIAGIAAAGVAIALTLAYFTIGTPYHQAAMIAFVVLLTAGGTYLVRDDDDPKDVG
jgi:hypothetical protein